MIATNKIKEFGQTGITGQDVLRFGNRPRRFPQERDRADYIAARRTEKIERILVKERDAHMEIYGRNFELKDFKDTLMEYPLDILEHWEATGWEIIFFPKMDVSKEPFFKDPKIGEENISFSEAAEAGKIMVPNSFDSFEQDKEALFLKGITVLVEKEPYDFSRSILKKIRIDIKAGQNYFSDLWGDRIRPAYAQELKVDLSQVRLKRVAEKLVLQFYKKKLVRKQEEEDLWEWCFECLDTPFTRLRGNSSWFEPGWYYDHRPDTSYYPLAVL